MKKIRPSVFQITVVAIFLAFCSASFLSGLISNKSADILLIIAFIGAAVVDKFFYQN